MENEFIVYQSKAKQVGLALLGLLMTLLGLIIMLVGLSEKKIFLVLVGIIALAFFGVCEFYIVKQVFKGKVVVRLNKDGFYDYSSALASKKLLIKWSDVQRIENRAMVNQEFVSVYLNDPESFLESLSALQKKAVQANIKMGFGEINITLQSAKKCTNEQLIDKMNGYIIQNDGNKN